MEVTEQKHGCDGVMAPSSASPSVIVSLHPMVIMNVSEHWTRLRAQQLGESTRVYGALLGKQKGRHIELCTSFEIKMNSDDEIDLEFLNTNIAQCNFFKIIIKIEME